MPCLSGPRGPSRPWSRSTRRVALAAPLAVGSLAVVLALGACSKSHTEAAAPAEATTANGGLTPEQSAQVLARVGDHTITLGDYATALEHMSRFDRMRYQAPERRKELLHEMIDVVLLADEARDKGYDKDPLVEQEIREVLRDAYFEKAREAAPSPAEIPDQEVRAYYDAHKADYHDPERRRVSAIVLPTAAAAAGVLDAAKGATAMHWGDLVRAKSVDPQAKAQVPADLAGDLGFVSPPGDERGQNPRIPDDVRAAVFEAATVGDVVPRVVKADAKFFVVKFAGKSDAHDRSLADAERTIRVKLAQDALVAKENAMVDALRQKYPVRIDEEAIAKLSVTVPADAGTAE
jgi:peptidyl-prolyl cis-trans isomerase C